MKYRLKNQTVGGMALALVITAATVHSARANVYATNIKLNGATNDVTTGAGGNVSISYILNEPASGGVAVRILSGNTTVRVINVAAGSAGTLRGANNMVWDGKDGVGANVPGGTYTVSITAASTGYTNWTQITDDTNIGNAVFSCRGLDVNKNTNSPYYGRVFVGNAGVGPGYPSVVADTPGIQKLNADSSPADEGGFADGGYAWVGDGYSPWRIKIGADDKVYVEHWSGNGNIFAWDQQLSAGSMQNIMRDDNNPTPEPAPPVGPVNYQGLIRPSTPQGNLGGFFVTGSGTNNQVWMSDNNTGGWGIMHWNAQADGTLAVGLSPDIAVRATAAHFAITNSDLDDSAFDVALDNAGNIYVAQQPWNNDQFKIFKFSPYTGVSLTNAIWKAGDTLTNDANDVTSIAVNPAGTLVAVSLGTDQQVQVLDGNTGTNVVSLSADGHAQMAVAWDNAGNLYNAFDGLAGSEGNWRAFSPPGANQATTVAIEKVVVNAPVLPHITSIKSSGGTVTIDFTGSASDDASAYVLQSAATVNGTFTDVAVTPIPLSPGVFRVSTAASGAIKFYRIKR
ncbi:FlgD immunoglobulin-like domain containing protein [Pedosphaera parvula]|uniref:FlgD/Vpr Ig-like domain-containing protein n=1 Tax=Pedosphaera parvula (strain Ellin514) TaxID=320771 RepID=B9XFE5_PEDPL|nr:FlgD immunoglobulin-like domain containing protein [Pedosphaera parvula]EEF61309.1 hypothetical protein Cflav_PD4330 [Pedosphaera parvula Ellin514]